KWIKNATALFLNPELAGATNAGNVSVTLTSQFKDKIRNVVNFGAKHGARMIGVAIDAGEQIYRGKDVEHATAKAIGHIGTGIVGRAAGTALVAGVATLAGVSVAPLIAVGAGIVIGTVAAIAFDKIYDKWGRDIVDNAVNVTRNAIEWVGNAISNGFSFLKSAFS
ncbi:MAG TPA: hypothetical protein VK072_07070, partial [Candidatus Avamphibacillus sp.]|nr:hypothetical protein [Candidatus Avamphibacillus sp.]